MFLLWQGRILGFRPRSGVVREGRDLLDEGWVYSVGCGGSCTTHDPRPVPPEARGVAGRDVADCARGQGGGLRRRRPPGFLGLCWSWSALAGAEGPLTESGTAFGSRNVPFLQMTEVVPQSSGGKRSPRRGSTFPIGPSTTSVLSPSPHRRLRASRRLSGDRPGCAWTKARTQSPSVRA